METLTLYDFGKELHKTNPDLAAAVKRLKALFEGEDILEHVFGDGVSVVVNHEEIIIEEYCHD